MPESSLSNGELLEQFVKEVDFNLLQKVGTSSSLIYFTIITSIFKSSHISLIEMGFFLPWVIWTLFIIFKITPVEFGNEKYQRIYWNPILNVQSMILLLKPTEIELQSYPRLAKLILAWYYISLFSVVYFVIELFAS